MCQCVTRSNKMESTFRFPIWALISPPFHAPPLSHHMKDPLVSMENKWGWPLLKAHEIHPLQSVSRLQLWNDSPWCPLSISKEKKRWVVSFCPFLLSHSNYPIFHLSSAPVLLFIQFFFFLCLDGSFCYKMLHNFLPIFSAIEIYLCCSWSYSTFTKILVFLFFSIVSGFDHATLKLCSN